MPQDPRAEAACLLRWRDVYSEAELYKAAVRLYTKPVFQWRKASSTSTGVSVWAEHALPGALTTRLRGRGTFGTATFRGRRRPLLPITGPFGGKATTSSLAYLLRGRISHCRVIASKTWRRWNRPCLKQPKTRGRDRPRVSGKCWLSTRNINRLLRCTRGFAQNTRIGNSRRSLRRKRVERAELEAELS